jgi:hypothetical protein
VPSFMRVDKNDVVVHWGCEGSLVGRMVGVGLGDKNMCCSAVQTVSDLSCRSCVETYFSYV